MQNKIIMKRIQIVTLIVSIFLTSTLTTAQNSRKWSLIECINYALSNNIEVKSSTLTILEASENLKQAKESLFPTLSFSTSHNIVNQKIDNGQGNFSNSASYSGNYYLNSGITIYNGGTLTSTIKQKELLHKSSELSKEEVKNNIEITVTQAYLQILYAGETVKTNIETAALSMSQLERAKALYEAGTISSVDLAQFQSQLSSDNYQLTLSINTLEKSKLTLKQILELGLNEEFDIIVPELDDSSLLVQIPTVSEVYSQALEIMPQIESSKVMIENAKIEKKISEAAMLPTITANASVGTGNINNSSYTFSEQLNNRLTQNIGLSMSIPIFNKRSVKTQINKSNLQIESALLNNTSAEKQLLSTIEGLHQEAVSSRSRYLASKDKLKYYSQSYNLINEQFNSGMKNTVELLTEKKNLLAAQQELLESKFQSILSLKLLKFYQNESISL